jgi:hypothetical protein
MTARAMVRARCDADARWRGSIGRKRGSSPKSRRTQKWRIAHP